MEVKYYKTKEGKSPFLDWLNSFNDVLLISRIEKRIDRIKLGNMGDHKGVGEGIIELRLFFGSGYRLYCAKEGETIIIMLCGGDKSSQSKDIAKAKEYWNDYRFKSA